MVWFTAFWHLLGAGVVDGGPGLLAAAAVVLLATALAIVVVLLLALVRLRPQPPAARRLRPTQVPRHRDPDAAGRARPRAPTAAPVAA